MAKVKVTEADVDENESMIISATAEDEVDLAVVTGEGLESREVIEYAKELAFMAEKVTFVVGETTDINAVNPVPAGVNGKIKYFTRGEEYCEPRHFLDSLICRENSVQTRQYRDGENIDQTKISSKHALKYPISIINDPSGKLGIAWFKFACNHN